MNIIKLKETMNQIHIRKEMQEEIIMNVKNQMAKRQKKTALLKKTVASAAALALILGAAVPIQAGIRYLLKDRLESIPAKKLKTVNQMLQNQNDVQADRYSRELSKEEKKRMKQMEEAYLGGKFPEHTIPLTDSLEIAPKDLLCYDTDTGTFCLPKQILTDEELLQIIDFNYTTDYALAKGSSAQNAKKEQEAEENRIKAVIQDEGGISNQDALKVAAVYLKSEFGLSAEGLEPDLFLDENPEHRMVYHVSYETQDDTAFYSYGIDISVKDGSLLDTSYARLPR